MFDLLTRERATNLVWTDEAHDLIGSVVLVEVAKIQGNTATHHFLPEKHNSC